MSRNIVLLADGTGNSAAKAFKTNVWRLYEALDLGGADQIAVFSDGVGTSRFKPFEIIGLALGFGVKRRVLALYKFLCLNYRDDDKIYAFGFSRGAFTIRVLVGLIAREGLVSFGSQEELQRNALAAYRAYREKAFPSRLPWVVLGRRVRDWAVVCLNRLTRRTSYSRLNQTKTRSAGAVTIRFLGVWDTVAAYGLPVDELTKAVDRWVWPMTFESKGLLQIVDCARQAFSIDDERRTFFPIRWDEELNRTANGGGPAARLLQVWFAGTHSNVGGGYPDDRLAHIPLCWMIGEAAENGLAFKSEVVADYWDYASESGRIYDSRSGPGLFYRYHPRAAGELMGSAVTPIVDASVVLRIANGSDRYAPISLPEDVLILTPLGQRLPFRGPAAPQAPVNTTATIVDKLPLPPGRPRNLAKMDQELRDVVSSLQQPRHPQSRAELVEVMRDTVWWRRGLYYVMLGFAVLAALFPLFAGYLTNEVTDRGDQISKGVIAPVVGLLKGFLPGFAAPWPDAVAEHPVWAILLGAAFALCVWLNSVLRIRIQDRARAAWNVIALKHNAGRAGVVAAPTTSHQLPLRIARYFRTSDFFGAVYIALREYILPAVFLAISTALILFFLNKVSFEVANSAGAFCPAEPKNAPQESDKISKNPTPFRTSDMCLDTHNWLEKGVHYKITITQTEPWFDDAGCADTRGMKGGFVHYVGTLTKRWWGEPWFKPIARIGEYGNDEYVLDAWQPTVSDKECGNNQLVAHLVPRTSGELYVYVNYAAVGLPYVYGWFYHNNDGSATISVELLKDSAPAN